MAEARQPWVIILAGGSGRRLESLTTRAHAEVVPKQFCRLSGPESLLTSTLARARSLAPLEQLLTLVVAQHRHWWEPELAALRPENRLVEPDNRGTALALLRGLHDILGRDPHATVVVLPSDHVVDDEGALRAAILEAVRHASRRPKRVVLLGAPAAAADPTLGWIVPADGAIEGASEVAEFVEKPDAGRLAECTKRGGLHNTLIMAGGAAEILRLYATALPALFARRRRHPGAVAGGVTPLDALPTAGMQLDLGRDILARAGRWLRVLPLPPCGWADIGTPERLIAWWHAHPEVVAELERRGLLPPEAHLMEGAGT